MDPFRQGGSPTLEALATQTQGAVVPRQSSMLTEVQIRGRLERAANVVGDTGSGLLIGGALLGGLFSFLALVIAVGRNTARLGTDDKVAIAMMFVVTAVMAGFGVRSSRLARRRRDAAIAQLLAWPDTLPFPTDGWREWLVADRPLIDVVLRGHTATKTFAEAARAIDGAIEVEAIAETTFRLVMPSRTVTLDSGIVRFGDVALADKLFSMMLVPVHQELGIASVHFGGAITDRR